MNKIKILSYLLFAIIIVTSKAIAQDTLLNIMSDELNREYSELKNQPLSSYYIEYRVDDVKTYVLNTSFGSLVNQNEDKARLFSTVVRVGNYDFDNSHEIDGANGIGGAAQPFAVKLPYDNIPEALKFVMWQATHYAYRSAVDSYNQVQSSSKSDMKQNKAADFSNEKPSVYFEGQVNDSLKNLNEWISRLKKYSEPFLADDKIISADATLSYYTDRKYFVSSEGSKIVQNSRYCQLMITAAIKTEEGGIVPAYRSYYTFTPEEMPSNDEILEEIHGMMVQLEKLKDAPLAEAYSGPAILSPGAAAVFFHEIFGHRIEGHRLKSNFDSQTFKTQIDARVLPPYMNIYSDPTISMFDKQDMFGYYKYDDQGIESHKVVIVKDGVLKNFLMSRSPIEGFPNSNGHGRAQPGLAPVARQSNLIVETKKPVSGKDLRKKLIAECKKQDKEYGFLFDQVVGGFTVTNRFSPNVFNVKPTVVYKIFVDGRPDELVRGVDFIGTPLAIFSEIAATGDNPGVFTGYCGAESGSIPVTALSPALFIKKIETQKQPEGIGQMPILPRPDVEKFQNNNK